MRTTELMLVLMIIMSLNEAAPLYIEVLVNETAIISCFPNEDIHIQWHHTAPSRSITFVYAGGKFYISPLKGFRLEIDSNTGPYHLIIPHARYEDAGLYECKEDIGSRVFGSTQLTVLASRPVCGSNMKAQGYVGPSTCNLEQEHMTFTCAVSYNGVLPQMKWTILNDSQPLNESKCKIGNGRINCSLTLKADPKYDGSIFICQSHKSTANCSTEIIKIQYFESDLKREEKTISDKVNCSVKSNQILQFNWIKLQDNQSVIMSEGQTLLIQSPGLYRCIVEYRIRNVNCSAFGYEVFAFNPSVYRAETGQGTLATITVLSIIAVICDALIIALVLLNRFRVKISERSGINGEEEVLLSQLNDLSDDQQEERPLHVIAIENNYKVLQRCTDVNYYVAGCLRGEEVLDSKQESLLNGEKDPQTRVRLLFDWLKEMEDGSKYEKFLEVMEREDVGQQHVSILLRGETSENRGPLRDSRYARLLRIRPKLAAALGCLKQVENLLSLLKDSPAINDTDYDEIDKHTGKLTRSYKLVGAIMRRSDEAFDVFKQNLIYLGRQDLAEYLDRDDG